MFCVNKVMPYTTNFTQYGWTDVMTTCNTLQTEYTTMSRKIYYVHKDQLNSSLVLTDESGAVVRQYSYDVYGKPYVLMGTGYVDMQTYMTGTGYTNNARENDRLFTGREYDVETGLYSYRARIYSPSLGRFLNRDPI